MRKGSSSWWIRLRCVFCALLGHLQPCQLDMVTLRCNACGAWWRN